ncbi:hypothetical protein LR948_00300 [Roseivivax sp. GX 12232]|uniref:hypothetical protein n=1 Tax=Roseivivax sp. GX 12232 TaxID=2900547 RepID=UPI001E5E5131|nr:hypothetical protein [Roseivivax sp. GX 12232]MCE0503784.1 hypothetical protein [Roseivivax sp. GX 12232]
MLLLKMSFWGTLAGSVILVVMAAASAQWSLLALAFGAFVSASVIAGLDRIVELLTPAQADQPEASAVDSQGTVEASPTAIDALEKRLAAAKRS